MRPRLRHWLAAALITVIVVLAFRGIRGMLHRDPLAVLRDSVVVLRAAADSCRAETDTAVAGLRLFSRRLDSMRSRVRDLETGNGRGVPIDSYTLYMDAFIAYNRGAGEWPEREDTVRALNDRCRDLARVHNTLVDSLRRATAPARGRRR